jgi:hypothetical protein
MLNKINVLRLLFKNKSGRGLKIKLRFLKRATLDRPSLPNGIANPMLFGVKQPQNIS